MFLESADKIVLEDEDYNHDREDGDEDEDEDEEDFNEDEGEDEDHDTSLQPTPSKEPEFVLTDKCKEDIRTFENLNEGKRWYYQCVHANSPAFIKQQCVENKFRELQQMLSRLRADCRYEGSIR